MSQLSQGRARIAWPSRSIGLGYVPWAALAVDTVLCAGSVVVAGVGRNVLVGNAEPRAVLDSMWLTVPCLTVLWIALLAGFRAYRPSVLGAGTDEYKLVLGATSATAALVGVGSFLGRIALSRGFFLLTFVVGAVLLILGRLLLRRLIYHARRHGRLTYRVIIAGSEAHIDEIAVVLRRERWLGYDVVGAVMKSDERVEETRTGVPVLGNIDDLAELLSRARGDVLFVTDGAFGSPAMLREAAWRLEQRGVQVVIAPGVTDIARERVRARPVGGLPLIHLEPTRAVEASKWLKRTFDIVVSLSAIVAVLPLMTMAAAWIHRHDRGPVLFRQTRVGRDGVAFTCLKFRSMVVDAEASLARLHTEAGFESGLFKMRDDPRVTKPGRVLRRYSLDELPQLFNVLRGDMSLIGPRPPLPSEVARYDDRMSRRLTVRPGVTGLWQVSGRSDLSFEDAMRLDLYYVDNWSMVQDLVILGRTVSAVFNPQGAY